MSKPLVMIADDYADVREMYAEYLRFEGFDVIEVTDGQSALDAALAHQPAVILMDVKMPGIDGLEATRRLKGDPRTRRILVCVVSAYALKAEQAQALAAGCDKVLAKPCLPVDLAREVKSLLAHRCVEPDNLRT